MIRVFRATDVNYNTNGEKIIKPIEAVITKTIEEEYLELDAPLKYADFLVQDNILIVDTLTGKKGYAIFNPIINVDSVSVKAWLCYQEHAPAPADRGVVISHGKNLADCEVTENWDNVVTKLIPVGYNETQLPEGFISIPSPYQKVYEKTIEFDLSEDLVEIVESMEENIELNQTLVASLENSISILEAKIPAYEASIIELNNEKAALTARKAELEDKQELTDVEKKELAVITAQIPLVDDNIAAVNDDITAAQNALSQTQSDLAAAQEELTDLQAEYEDTIITDLRSQAQAYLNEYQYPEINYDLEAHLEGIIEIGDIVKVKHPDMRVDLLTSVISYKLDCLTLKFKQIEFGTLKQTLKGKLTEIEEKIEDTKETVKNVGQRVEKYKSEYKRDNEEMVSKFISELYGTHDGIYKLLERNQSVFRQTASEITGTVSRLNADLSQDIASLSIRADSITAEVTRVNTDLSNQIATLSVRADGISATVTANYNKHNQDISALDIKANQIQSQVTEVRNDLTTAQSTITQQANQISLRVEKNKVISEINQSSEAITINAAKISLTGYVTMQNLSTAGQTTINGGNITTGKIKSNNYVSGSRGMQIDLDSGLIDSKNFKIKSDGSAEFSGAITSGATITGATFTNGSVTIDNTNITISGSSGYLKGKVGSSIYNLIGFQDWNNIVIGNSAYGNAATIRIWGKDIHLGYSSTHGFTRVYINDDEVLTTYNFNIISRVVQVVDYQNPDYGYIRLANRIFNPSNNQIYLGSPSYRFAGLYAGYLSATGDVLLGSSQYTKFGVFGSSGAAKTSIADLPSNYTLETVANKLQAVINALQSYGMI